MISERSFDQVLAFEKRHQVKVFFKIRIHKSPMITQKQAKEY